LPRFNRNAVQPRVAAIQLGAALVAHLAQRNLLLILQVTADIGIFAIIVPALGQFIILLPVQAVDLVIEIDFEFSTGIWWFGLAAAQHYRRREQEGPDRKGMLVHTSLPGTFIWLPDQASLPVLIYEEWLRRIEKTTALSRHLAAKHAVDKHEVSKRQGHAEGPPDQAVRE
jgi:hypothetical protein